MNAKNKRPTTLMEREMKKSPERATRIRALAHTFTLESQIQHAMEQQNITAKDLAARMAMDKGMLSRDLSGGISQAKLPRIAKMAHALGYELIPLLVPVDKRRRKQSLESTFDTLLNAQRKRTHTTPKRTRTKV